MGGGWRVLIGIEDVNDFCTQCREELGVVDLPGFGLQGLV
jgi:hypothetical protein